jgi:glycosyltransferase involved in cell wall biosynthesis
MARKNKLRIAIVAPPFGEIGGPEVVVKNLTDALLKKGVDVTLFSPADWKTKAKHIATLPQSLWNMKDFKEQTEIERRNLILENHLTILLHQKKFDIIHVHSQRYAYITGKLLSKPCLLTIHNKIASREFNQIRKAGIHTTMLSKSHKGILRASAIISNGIAIEQIPFSSEKEGYLITIGRLEETKGIDIAIKIAQKVNKKLLIFGRIGNSIARQAYFNEKIKPHLNKQIIYMGEASQRDIFKYLKNADALLFPIKPRKKSHLSVVPLVVMEALACGTPVIGTNIIPIPKDITASSISCLSTDINVLIQAASTTEKFNPKKCRQIAEKYFDNSVMAEKYIRLYEKIIAKNS